MYMTRRGGFLSTHQSTNEKKKIESMHWLLPMAICGSASECLSSITFSLWITFLWMFLYTYTRLCSLFLLVVFLLLVSFYVSSILSGFFFVS